MYIVIAILALDLMIIVHELGHFFVGRKMGITVLAFSIGFGPKLFGWTRNGTEYTVRLVLFGGYCKFLGEDENDHAQGSMLSVKPWRRFLTILSGPLANFLMAAIFMMAFMMINGNNVPIVVSIAPESLAGENGLQVGDVIRKVGSTNVEGYFEVSDILAAGGNPTQLTVSRDDQTVTLTIPRIAYDGGQKLGISIGWKSERISIFRSMSVGMRWLFYMTKEMYQMLGQLITGKAAQGTIMGPVGTIGLIAKTAQQSGFLNFMLLIAIMSLNLSVFNLLPLPALDGGRLIFLIYEMIRKKPFPPEKEGLIHLVGLALLFALMIFLTFSDIRNMFS